LVENYKNMKQLGIVGGLGPETGCRFFLNVNNKVIRKTNLQPNLLMENVPMPESALRKLAFGKKPKIVKELLIQSIKRLNHSGADLIAIPCNTVHVFIDQLRDFSKAPIVSIIEESAKECARRGFKKVGLIGSTTSVKESLHITELKKRNISWVIPTKKQQQKISGIIVNIVTNRTKERDKENIKTIINELKNRGADSVLLACTDIRTIILEDDLELPMIETTSVLEDVIAKKLAD